MRGSTVLQIRAFYFPPYNGVHWSMKFYLPSNYHLRCWIRGADKNGHNRYRKTWLRYCNRCLPLMSAAMWKHKSEISGKSLSQIVQSKGDIFVSNCSSTLSAVGSVRWRKEARARADVELTIDDKLFNIKAHMFTYDASYIADCRSISPQDQTNSSNTLTGTTWM